MKILTTLTIVLCGVFVILIVATSIPKGKQRIQIGSKTLHVIVANTTQLRNNGLSNSKKLPENEGMLFIFDAPNTYQFWMKDMNYDLDFIYIRDGKVVGLIENVPAPKNNKGNVAIVASPVPFTQVLEVNSGFIKKNKISVGQKVKLVT